MMNVSVRNNKGFSLVELMVVVAIIGILAAVAVPNFQRFSAKSKQSEAKANLAMLYASEASFYGEWSTYTGDFLQVGLRLQGILHYHIANAAVDGTATLVGYTGPIYAAANVDSGATVCSGVTGGGVTGCVELPGSATVAGATPAMTGAVLAMTGTTYLSGASGTLVPGGTNDTWTVSQFKVFNNPSSGLP